MIKWQVIKTINELLRYAYILVRESYFIEYRTRRVIRKSEEMASRVEHGALLYMFISFLVSIVLAGMLGLSVMSRRTELLASATLSMSTMCFIFTFIFVSLYSWILQEYRLLEPLRVLPLSEDKISLIVSLYSLFYVLPMIFSPLIFLLIVLTKYPELLVAVHILLGTYSSIILSIGLAYSLANFMISYGKVSGRVLKAKISRLISVAIFVVAMFLFQISQGLIGYLTKLLTQMVETPTISALWFVYPISIIEGVRSSLSDLSKSLQLLLVQIVYTFIFSVFYVKSFNKYYAKVTTPVVITLRYEIPPIISPRRWTMNKLVAIIIKDFKTVIREPRTASLVFLPLYSTAVFLISLLSAKSSTDPRFLDFLFAVYAGMLIMLMPSVSLQLVMSEGKAVWFSLHVLGKRQLLKGKILFTILTCATYSVTVALAMSLMFKTLVPLVLAIEALLISYAVSCVVAKIIAPSLTPTTRAMPRFTITEILMFSLISSLMTGIPLGAYYLMRILSVEVGGLLVSLIICLLEVGIGHSMMKKISEGAL